MSSNMSITDLSLLTYRDNLYKKLGIKNNIVLSSAFNLVFASLVPAFMTFVYNYVRLQSIKNHFTGIYSLLFNYNVVTLEGDIIKKGRWESYTSFSERIKGLLYYISTLNVGYKTNNIKQLKEIIHNDLRSWDTEETDSHKKPTFDTTQFIVDQTFQFSLSPKLYCKIITKEEDIDSNGGVDGKRITYTIKVYSYKYSLTEILEFLDKCIDKYKLYLKNKTDKQFFCTIKNSDKDKIMWNKFVFKSNRNFDNMYISCKNEIVDKINFFINNKDYYAKMGRPYTLGLLFHGEPGTGKTSFIKALANLLKRHIIEIPLKKIHSCESLYNAFYTEGIEGLSLKFDEKIIILEDIDAMGDIVKKRIFKPADKRKEFEKNRVEKEDSDDGDEDKPSNKSKKIDFGDLFSSLITDSKNDTKTVNDVCLSFLLNLMEGILEMDGRIIIMTTNHIDKIDPALIRPGRIDIKINFKLLDNIEINKMVKFYIPGWEDIKLSKQLHISHAKLMNIIISTQEDIGKIKTCLENL